MKIQRAGRSALLFSGALAGLTGAFIACTSAPSDSFDGGYGPGPGSTGTSTGPGSNGEGGSASGEGGSGSSQDPAEILFLGLESQFVQTCGGTSGGNQCHVTGTFDSAPAFLKGTAPTDVYKTIKTFPGIVVPNVYSSIILTKGLHEGPDISTFVSFNQAVVAWLNQEALELQSVALPTTDPFTVTLNADNNIDISKAATGVTGVHLLFHASLIGTSLSFTNLQLMTAAGAAVHLNHPVFYEIPATKANPADPDTQDPQDSFSNTDITVPGGSTTALPPGTVIFTGFGNWDGTAKLRMTAYTLAAGTLTEAATIPQCTNPTLFGTTVAPLLNGGTDATPLTCAKATTCHGQGGNGQGGMDLSGISNATKDYAGACAAVLNKINTTTPASSLIIQYPTGKVAHPGGTVTNTATFTTDMTGFITNGSGGQKIF